jgi:hypothetical protein
MTHTELEQCEAEQLRLDSLERQHQEMLERQRRERAERYLQSQVDAVQPIIKGVEQTLNE